MDRGEWWLLLQTHYRFTTSAATHLELTWWHSVFTTLYAVILVSHFTRPEPFSSAGGRLCCVQIKAAKRADSALSGWCIVPYYPQCFAPFHRLQALTSVSGAPFLSRPAHGAFSMLRISPIISNYPPLTDCLVSLALCRLDMMILRLQCKWIHFFWYVVCMFISMKQ